MTSTETFAKIMEKAITFERASTSLRWSRRGQLQQMWQVDKYDASGLLVEQVEEWRDVRMEPYP